MTSRSWRWQGFGVTLEAPEGVGRLLRRLRPQRTRRPTAVASPPDQLILGSPRPLVFVKRDPERALDAVREFWRRGEPGGARARSSNFLEATDRASALADEVARRVWYHTIELPGGIVTQGIYDHRPSYRTTGFQRTCVARGCSTWPRTMDSGPSSSSAVAPK